MKLDLNPQFKRALALIEESEQYLFITGKAGTGKSTLLDYFCNNREEKADNAGPNRGGGTQRKGTDHSPLLQLLH